MRACTCAVDRDRKTDRQMENEISMEREKRHEGFMASSRDSKCARPAGLISLRTHVTTINLTSLGGAICSMAVGPDGTLIVCTNSAIFVLSKDGQQALITGHKTETGFKDGQDGKARFNFPFEITVHDEGHLLVSDTYNHAVRKVTLSGSVSTLAGNGTAGFADGVGVTARLNMPRGIIVDDQNDIFVADTTGKTRGFADGQRAAAFQSSNQTGPGYGRPPDRR